MASKEIQLSMDELEDKLNLLNEDELEFLLGITEDKLQETIITFNEQKVRLTEIFKFSIPVLGALIYQLFSLHSKEENYDHIKVGILLLVVFSVGILIWCVALYLPSQLAAKGKLASVALSKYNNEVKKKQLLIDRIIQYEKSIKINSNRNKMRSGHLLALTITILTVGSLAAIVFALAFVI